jgi:hypothetical protein
MCNRHLWDRALLEQALTGLGSTEFLRNSRFDTVDILTGVAEVPTREVITCHVWA